MARSTQTADPQVFRRNPARKYRSRSEFVLSNLDRLRHPRAILDLGFIGVYAESFIHNGIVKSLADGDHLTGLDIQDAIGKYADTDKTTYRKASLFNLEEMPEYSGHFDAVVLCEVFEHLPHPYLALHKIHYALQAGGTLVLTYPNPLSWKGFVKFLLQRDILEKGFVEGFMGHHEHKVFPFPVCMVKYLSDLGFDIQELAFLKGLPARIPYLDKFSDYIGIIARKRAAP
jgi:2-polyprenyl-3-methyl-5-hydroxy-6-metoxy-1,4-benzoquinol methylase